MFSAKKSALVLTAFALLSATAQSEGRQALSQDAQSEGKQALSQNAQSDYITNRLLAAWVGDPPMPYPERAEREKAWKQKIKHDHHRPTRRANGKYDAITYKVGDTETFSAQFERASTSNGIPPTPDCNHTEYGATIITKQPTLTIPAIDGFDQAALRKDIAAASNCRTTITKQPPLLIGAIDGVNPAVPADDGEDAPGVDDYTQAMREKVRERWNPPFGTRYDIDVRFHIQPDGCVSNVQVTTPGVPPELAKSLVDAIAYSSPLDPLPDGCDSDGINVNFFFAKEDSPKHRETTPTSGPIYTPLPSTVKGPTNNLPSLAGTHPFSPDDIAAAGRKVAEKLQAYLAQGKMDPSFVQAEQTADLAAGGASGIDQGPHDNCWFECSLAAFARFPRGQQVIANMITSNGDGSYTVLFPGDPDRPVQVTKNDITSMRLKDASEWARIIEAAEIKLYPLNSRTAVTGNKHIPAITRGLRLVTGSKTAYLNFNNCTKEDILNFLEHGSDGAHVMVATSEQAPSPDRQYVIPNHGFSVIQYNPQEQTVILRNPWGHNGHKSEREHWPNLPAPGQESYGVTNLGGGLVKMEVSTFEHLYRNIAIARIR